MNFSKILLNVFLFVSCGVFANGAQYDNDDIFNPSVFEISSGEQIFKKYIKTKDNLAKYFGTNSNQLESFIAGFPQTINNSKQIFTLKQALQYIIKNKIKANLPKHEYRYLLIYIASLSNGQSIKNENYNQTIYVNAIKKGKRLFSKQIGKMGYACVFCHKLDGKQDYYKNQQIPQLRGDTFANKWPSYCISKGYSISMEEKIQEHLKDFGITNKQINQKDITDIILYIKSNNQDKKQITPSFSK